MPRALPSLAALAFALRLFACSEPELVIQEERAASGDLYYTYFHSYITSNSPHYLIRVSETSGEADTLYASENFFSFELAGDSVLVTTCRAETGFEQVSVVEREDYDCLTNRPILARRKR